MLNTPLQMLVVMVAGWVNEQHRAVIDYLKEENRVLRELHGKKRFRRVLRQYGSIILPRDQLPMHGSPSR